MEFPKPSYQFALPRGEGMVVPHPCQHFVLFVFKHGVMLVVPMCVVWICTTPATMTSSSSYVYGSLDFIFAESFAHCTAGLV